MATPWNIRGSASQLFFQDKTSSEYQALVAIADIPHPDRSMLGSFINDACDPEEAARYFLHMTGIGDGSKAPPVKTISQFLSEWKFLVKKFRPTSETSLSNETKMHIYERDGGYCCITRTPFKSYLDRNLEYVHIVPLHVFTDPDLAEGTSLFEMLSRFLSRELLEVACSSAYKQLETLDNLWLLSTQVFNVVEKGVLFLTAQSWRNDPDVPEKQIYNIHTNLFKPQRYACLYRLRHEIKLVNRTPQITPSLSVKLVDIHARFSKSLVWLETKEYMDATVDGAQGRGLYPSSLVSPFSSLLRKLWISIPPFVRASVYDILLRIGFRIYGRTLSMTVFKLPFGLYLRRGAPASAPKYHVEAHTLQMIEQSTHIPAPRAIDVLETPRFSYLLMTCVPGRPIGQVMDAMSDEQVKQAVNDLKNYILELREIRNNTGEFRICNSQGGGILDWRIPDSQREELRFRSEDDFNKYLTHLFVEEIRKRAAKSHDTHHEIFFTHGDLNPRNILAENGRISGIVDWENAGWFPEYWEYTKAHYSVRSLRRWLADFIDEVFEGYREELLVENMLSDLLGPY
ncbi:kinase-like protein [Aspergillus coremiiformis]|uniref:Kinase-like protein n=1 Tax=Aspergillus coremiiformis TaxID=138285 RepID=A0A5N6Z4A1_9EURO|nr:kinase-like protein [Aspergillus coremiiformis]